MRRPDLAILQLDLVAAMVGVYFEHSPVLAEVFVYL